MRKGIICIIPARGGSKRIPGKNIAILDGKPMIYYTISEALSVKSLDAVIVSTDDGEIARISKGYGASIVYPRPAELATDTASTVDAVKHAVTVYEGGAENVDSVVILQPTSPFRDAIQISEAIDFFYSSGADTLTSVKSVKEHPYWVWKKDGTAIVPLYTFAHMTMERKGLPEYFIENGSIFIIKRQVLFNDGIYGKKVVPFRMSERDSVDIDEQLDLEWARYLMSRDKKEVKLAH